MKTFAQFTPNLRFTQAITSFFSHFQTTSQARGNLRQAHTTLARKLNIKPSQVLLTHGGRAALYACLKNMQKNNKAANQVVLPAYTCRVLINPILKAELQPVFTDLNASNLRSDLYDLDTKLSPKTLAVMVQNTFGAYDDWESIAKLIKSKAPKAKLVCDNAHFLPNTAELQEQAKYFDYAIFSFGTNKILSASGLGALVSLQRPLSTNTQATLAQLPKSQAHKLLLKNWVFSMSMKLYDTLKLGKTVMFLANKLNLIPKVVSNAEKKLHFTDVDFYQAHPLLGLSLSHALKFYQSEITHRVLIKSIYQCNLKKSLQYDKWFRKAPIFFPIQVKSPKKLHKILLKHGYQTNLDWSRHLLVPFSKARPLNFQEDLYPQAKQVSKHTLCLPLNQTVSPHGAVAIVELINKYAK